MPMRQTNYVALLLLITICGGLISGVSSLHVTSTPPLVDVPVYSMATLNPPDKTGGTNGGSTTNMNILTYATPVSVRPDRVWALGLYKGTLSHENFSRTRTCILQLLTAKHIPLVRLLGGSSGNDLDKRQECSKLAPELAWRESSSSSSGDPSTICKNSEQQPQILPDCAYYLKLTAIGDIVDGGSHDVVICKVEEMLVTDHSNEAMRQEHLSTAKLRELGIITEQGRVAE
eukprot:scaffold208462_cov68-Attheya_sp.AAC.1